MLSPLGNILAWTVAHWKQLAVLFLVAVPVAWASVQVDRWMRPVPEPRTDTVTVAEPLGPGDILDATTPAQVTEHDTSETSRQCIEVPTWLASSPRTQSASERPPNSLEDSTRRSENRSVPQSGRLTRPTLTITPTFAITPLTSGSPSLSVGSEQVQLQGYLPTGEGRQWTYDIPQEQWHLWPSVGAETTPAGLQATATANLRWEKVTARVGYMQAADSRGITFGVHLRPFTISW